MNTIKIQWWKWKARVYFENMIYFLHKENEQAAKECLDAYVRLKLKIILQNQENTHDNQYYAG